MPTLKPLPPASAPTRELPARLMPAVRAEGCRRCPGCAVADTAASARCGVPLKRLHPEDGRP